jgi:hypothetical protein
MQPNAELRGCGDDGLKGIPGLSTSVGLRTKTHIALVLWELPWKTLVR